MVSAVFLFVRSFYGTNIMLSFHLLAIFTVKCNDSVSFFFLFPSFLFCSLNSFFSIKGNCCFFEL